MWGFDVIDASGAHVQVGFDVTGARGGHVQAGLRRCRQAGPRAGGSHVIGAKRSHVNPARVFAALGVGPNDLFGGEASKAS
jgi:hypothetical protein